MELLRRKTRQACLFRMDCWKDVSGATAQDYDMLGERLSSWTLLSALVLLSSYVASRDLQVKHRS